MWIGVGRQIASQLTMTKFSSCQPCTKPEKNSTFVDSPPLRPLGTLLHKARVPFCTAHISAPSQKPSAKIRKYASGSWPNCWLISASVYAASGSGIRGACASGLLTVPGKGRDKPSEPYLPFPLKPPPGGSSATSDGCPFPEGSGGGVSLEHGAGISDD